MKQSVMMDKYTVFEIELDGDNSSCGSVDEIVERLKRNIEEHPKATFIGVFDHLAHTRSIDGETAPDIREAKNLILCFGARLPGPRVLALRPRSIGIAEMEGGRFVVSFMEPPMELAMKAMESWCDALADKAS